MSQAGLLGEAAASWRAQVDIMWITDVSGRASLPTAVAYALRGSPGTSPTVADWRAHTADTDTSQLVIMDAASMDNTPVATVELPRIPSGFHGSWIPASVAD